MSATTHSHIACLKTLTHRGPDNCTYYEDRGVFLGATRLAITDPSPHANMPLSGFGGRLYIVFNGEIYNYHELKERYLAHYVCKTDSDTEVLLALYKRLGKRCVSLIRGMFAFAIWDSVKRELFVATDQMGKKPLKYYQDSNWFIFASETKAILKHPAVKRTIDASAVWGYLAYTYIPGQRTGFQNIFKLEPGTCARFSTNRGLSISRYWGPQTDSNTHPPTTSLIKSTIEESLELRMKNSATNTPVFLLSGGLDSSLLLNLARKYHGGIVALTMAFPGKKQDEARYARLVVEKAPVKHVVFHFKDSPEQDDRIFSHVDEPLADASLHVQWQLYAEAARHGRIVISGDGADELFGGYQRYAKMHHLFPPRNNRSYRVSHMWRVYSGLLGVWSGAMIDLLANTPRSVHEDIRLPTNSSSGYQFARILDFTSYLPYDILSKADWASSAHGVEARAPYLDQHLFQLALRLPPSRLLSPQGGKAELKRIARSSGLPRLTYIRKKQGLAAPLQEWIMETKRETVHHFLQINDGTSFFDFISKRALKSIIQSENIHPKTLWRLYVLKKWMYYWTR